MTRDRNPPLRLPRSFHQTFKPERHYLRAMLIFASSGGIGTYQQIRDATGIPCGKSSGKVAATMDYCRGMGLVTVTDGVDQGVRCPILTPFGRAVLCGDGLLVEELTQWLAHLRLCRPNGGADAWYRVFTLNPREIGTTFTREQLESYLSLAYEGKKSSLIGPLVGMYEDSAAFAKCEALRRTGDIIVRTRPPLERRYAFGYGAWILDLIKQHFPDSDQVSVTDLQLSSGWLSTTQWDRQCMEFVLQLLQEKGILELDRHMDPWLVSARTDASAVWPRIYEDLL